MTDILDNANVRAQKDPSGALKVAAEQFTQTNFDARIWSPEHDNRAITSVVITGMGGSALAALVMKVVLQGELDIPFEIVRGYDLPAYVNEHTLVIASSYSGNTEETLSALEVAEKAGAQLAIVASGGKLIDTASSLSIAHIVVPAGIQPRMAMIYNLKSLFVLLAHFGVIPDTWAEDLDRMTNWLSNETAQWLPDVPTDQNYAKQLALQAVGKTPVFYGSPITAPLAYKWKISWNETAKNLAFWNEYPEFNHNEFMGWVSHPVEKPFVIFDIKSSFDSARVRQRFELSDRLLSGKRPAAHEIVLRGNTPLEQLVWGCILADFASIYTALLNGVDPVPVTLIEKLKQELADNPR